MTRACSCGAEIPDHYPLSERCPTCANANRKLRDVDTVARAAEKRRRNSKTVRRSCFDGHRQEDDSGRTFLICHLCGCRLDPALDRWEADHIRRYAEGGDDSAGNVWPACSPCHREKSRGDTTEVAKGKRVGAKRYGITRAKRPMDGSRGSRYRKRMDGTVERR